MLSREDIFQGRRRERRCQTPVAVVKVRMMRIFRFIFGFYFGFNRLEIAIFRSLRGELDMAERLILDRQVRQINSVRRDPDGYETLFHKVRFNGASPNHVGSQVWSTPSGMRSSPPQWK